ncbi:MAG: hypothetical protein LC750_15010 [Actinobacteria bacterium]|nr:hypothetical protein [Actinomycetota bacterium]
MSVIAALSVTPAVAGTRMDNFASTPIGNASLTMQLDTVPARVSRVSVRPGSDEAWALGTSTARRPGWSELQSGQVVFLKHATNGWALVGPPIDDRGVVNPVLTSFAIAGNGEGWAVGDFGVILHKRTDSDVWRVAQDSGIVDGRLNAVSLSSDGGDTVGFAVGSGSAASGPVVLMLAHGRWRRDPTLPNAAMTADTSEIAGVVAISSQAAWMVATREVPGSDSTGLVVYQRTSSGWTRLQTPAIFDSPPAKSTGGGLNHAASGAAIAADDTGVWIGGQMYPKSSTHAQGDPAPGSATRPFVLRYEFGSGAFTSYCPDQYDVRTADGNVDQSHMCDRPFPIAAYYVTSLQTVPGGGVFAGGLGLFRFSDGGWYRVPNSAGYLISIAMVSASEGWVASPGSSFGAGGSLRSSATTIGHLTNEEAKPALSQWSQPNANLLESVAMSGDGSGNAVAVGAHGGAAIFRGAWDSVDTPSYDALHGVAWPDHGEIWAVGEQGGIDVYRGGGFIPVESPTQSNLNAVAFRSAHEGVAVGAGGEIVTFDGARWTLDDSPTQADLYAITTVSGEYVAVGSDGAFVQGVPGRWRSRKDARNLLLREDQPDAPTLYTVAAFSDGTVLAGGQDSSLVARDPVGRISNFPAPLQGTILALAASGKRAFATVSVDPAKYNGQRPAALRGTVLEYEDGQWRDIQRNRHLTLYRGTVEPSAFEDPPYSIALSDDTVGWAVGGTPAELPDAEGHLRARMTSAVYRLDTAGDPREPATIAPLNAPKGVVSFAAFGETWCGTGFCSENVGSGAQADEVALAIRDEINRASLEQNGPRFVVFTGNMRGHGIPEELEQFHNFLSGFRIPVYGALGNLDRFGGFNSVSARTGNPSFDDAITENTDPVSGTTSDYWKQSFADAPAPWGTIKTKAPAGIVPYSTTAGTLVEGLARTHYAFDYAVAGRPAVRVVVVDSSTRSFGNAADQNPQFESQDSWLPTTLGDANVAGVPSIVVMNQPTVLPRPDPKDNWANGKPFESIVTGAGVSAVLTGGARINAQAQLVGGTNEVSVPMYIVGGGGAPLGYETAAPPPSSKLASDGYYNAWALVTVGPAAKNALAQSKSSVKVTMMPVLQSVAMHARRGNVLAAGHATPIVGWGRGLNGGFSDPEQAKSTYINVGDTLLPPCYGDADGNGLCANKASLKPKFYFYSENPDIADFVVPNKYQIDSPLRIGPDNAVALDPGGDLGLLCTFKIGTAWIDVVAGFHRSRMPMHVEPGFGPCNDKPQIAPVVPVVPKVPQPRVEAVKHFGHPPRVFVHSDIVALFPPPPAPVVAPAPPGAPGVGKKEEHEVEFETESHDNGHHSFQALQNDREEATTPSFHAQPLRHAFTSQQSHRDGMENAWPLLSAIVLIAFFGAACAAASRDSRRVPVEMRVR